MVSSSERRCLNRRCFGQEEDTFLAGRTGEFETGVAGELPKIDTTLLRDEGTLAKREGSVRAYVHLHKCTD